MVSFYLDENFNLDEAKNNPIEQFLPKVINMDMDMQCYCYYESGLIQPERTMDITAKNIAAFNAKK